MKSFMLDLETLGTTPGCVVLSIGIVPFNPFAEKVDDVLGDNGFHVVINKQSCIDAMLHVDNSTAQWWAKQSEEARHVLRQASDLEASEPLQDALEMTEDYVNQFVEAKKALIWGNGADFDNPILTVAARQVGVELPWKWGNRCYRTVKNAAEFMHPGFKAPKLTRHGTYHNALDDAKSQALHMWELLQSLRQHMEKTQ